PALEAAAASGREGVPGPAHARAEPPAAVSRVPSARNQVRKRIGPAPAGGASGEEARGSTAMGILPAGPAAPGPAAKTRTVPSSVTLKKRLASRLKPTSTTGRGCGQTPTRRGRES